MEYRLPRLEDKKMLEEYVVEHYSYGENNISASCMLTSMKWEDWVNKINNNVKVPDEVWGKSLTYLILDNNKLIGLLSIRYDLSEELVNLYGHIGYGIRPSERRKGYATKSLKYAIEVCKKFNMNSVILGCYKDNVASSKTIKKNGGLLIKETKHVEKISENWEIELTSLYYEIKL